MLSQIDVLVCGNSDPGTSGLLSPFAKVDGLYFDSSDEPCDFFYQLSKDVEEAYGGDDDIVYIDCDIKDAKEFYDKIKELDDYTNETISVSALPKEGQYDLVLNEHSDMDDMTKPSTVALAKKKKKQTVIEVVDK